jgi:hypothetical protein
MTLLGVFRSFWNFDPSQASRDAAIALAKLEEIVTQTYSPELWRATRAALAVIASLSLKGRSHPLALIFEGASGKGKSTVINMCNPDRDTTKVFLHRLDKFTAASFVSQAANVSKQQLENIDLLPKLKDKVLLTKELAPLFRGRDETLKDTFSTLTTVLDGKGYVNAAAVHGERGTQEHIVFNWIGGTTPIPAHTDTIMAQLGNRLVRYEILGEEKSDEAMLKFLEDYKESETEDQCMSLANTFIENHFLAFPINSVETEAIEFPHELRKTLMHLARLICKGRMVVEEIKVEGRTEYIAGDEEGPIRVALMLQNYARGYAMVGGKLAVDAEAIESVRHIAFSSIPRPRRRILRALLETRGQAESGTLAHLLHVTLPTARDWMRELAATGLVEFREGNGNAPNSVALQESWRWLIPAQVAAENEMPLCAATP